MLDYYKHNLKIDLVKEKLQVAIAQKMGVNVQIC